MARVWRELARERPHRERHGGREIDSAIVHVCLSRVKEAATLGLGHQLAPSSPPQRPEGTHARSAERWLVGSLQDATVRLTVQAAADRDGRPGHPRHGPHLSRRVTSGCCQAPHQLRTPSHGRSTPHGHKRRAGWDDPRATISSRGALLGLAHIVLGLLQTGQQGARLAQALGRHLTTSLARSRDPLLPP